MGSKCVCSCVLVCVCVCVCACVCVCDACSAHVEHVPRQMADGQQQMLGTAALVRLSWATGCGSERSQVLLAPPAKRPPSDIRRKASCDTIATISDRDRASCAEQCTMGLASE